MCFYLCTKTNENFLINIFVYIKMLNKYYRGKNKEKLWKEAHERYQNLSKKKKKKRRKNVCKRYQNLSEQEKKSVSTIVNVTRIFLKKTKKESWVNEKFLLHFRN